jgi:hypothetical protein
MKSMPSFRGLADGELPDKLSAFHILCPFFVLYFQKNYPQSPSNDSGDSPDLTAMFCACHL